MTIRDIARESKTLANNSDAHIQVTKTGRSYMTYKVYGNDYFKDGAGESTIGFINYPMTIKQVSEWLEEQKTFKKLAEA